MNGSNDKCAWFQFIKLVLYYLGFSHVWNNQFTFNASALLVAVKNRLKERFVLFWRKRLTSAEGMKNLKTYKLLKQKFGIKPYHDHLLDRNLSRYICAFRISVHRLRIERGRYYGEKPEDRLCDFCKVIENEIHFSCQYKKYDTLRLKMFDSINDSNLAKKKKKYIYMCVCVCVPGFSSEKN